MLYIPKIPHHTAGRKIHVCFAKHEFGDYAPDSDFVQFALENEDYTVTLNGTPCPVRDCRVSAIPFNRPWPGKQRPADQTERAGYVTFSADEPVTVRVTRKQPFRNAVLRPLSKGVTPVKDGDAVTFTVTEQGQYSLEFDGTHNALHIFFNAPHPREDLPENTRVFEAGIHFPGVIELRDNEDIYIDPEAIVFGSLHSAGGAKNVRVFGGGVLDNSCEERVTEECYEDFTKGCVRLYDCENIRIEDVILTNSSTWACALFGCHNVTLDNVKIVGQWRYNTDGIDIVNCDNVTVKNCFIRTYDDTISVKGIYDYQGVIENITVENCVLWNGWGQTLENGIEAQAKEYRNFVYRNCDIIHASGAAMSVNDGNNAYMHGFLFENIRVELQSDTLPQVLQKADAQVYDGYGKNIIPPIFCVRNAPYAIRNVYELSEDKVHRVKTALGKISDITFRNISVFTDSPAIRPHMAVLAQEAGTITDISVENLQINGERQKDFGNCSVRAVNADMPRMV